jgi:DUF971 family protein
MPARVYVSEHEMALMMRWGDAECCALRLVAEFGRCAGPQARGA